MNNTKRLQCSNNSKRLQCSTSAGTSCTASASTSEVEHRHRDCSIYARAWRFVQRRMHLRPRASSCPVGFETTLATNSISSSYCSDWRRIYVLKELEEACTREQWRRIKYQDGSKEPDIHIEPMFKTQAQRKTAQLTCYNCGQRFFRSFSDAWDTSLFCGRDCQSTVQYRRELQDAMSGSDTFRLNLKQSREA